MKIKICVFFYVLFTIKSIIYCKNIPVKVIYDELPSPVKSISNIEKKLIDNKSNNENLDNNVTPKVTILNNVLIKGIQNLNEKVQLTVDQLKEAVKLKTPTTDKIDIIHDNSKINEDDLNLIKETQKIVNSGLKMLRDRLSIEKNQNTSLISEESWKNLNETVMNYFENQIQNITRLKQASNQNQIIQNMVNAIQSIFSNFTQNFQQPFNNNSNEDEETPNPIQNFWNNISGGFQQIVNTIQNINNQSSAATNSTIISDTGVSTEPTNILSGFVSQVTSIFNGNKQQIANLNQSDTSTTLGSPGGIVQGTINRFNQVINSWRPITSSVPLTQQGDELVVNSTTQRNPIAAIQQISSQIGSAINQFTVFGQQQQTNKPSSGSEDETTSKPPNFIQNVGQVIQNINPFRPISGPQVVQGIQSVGNQIQEVANNQLSIIDQNSFIATKQNVTSYVNTNIQSQQLVEHTTNGFQNATNQTQ